MNESNENGLGWIMQAVSAAVSITSALIAKAKAKKAQKEAAVALHEAQKREEKAYNEAYSEYLRSEAVNILNNQYAQKEAEAQQNKTKTIIFAAVGVAALAMLISNKK